MNSRTVRNAVPHWLLCFTIAACGLAAACSARSIGDAGGDGATFDALETAVSDGSTGDGDEGTPRVIRVRVRVDLGPFLPPTVGEGFHVRAAGTMSARVDAVTDTLGTVMLALDASRAPWDLTIGRTGYLAVSMLGIAADIDTSVYSEPLVTARLAAMPRTLHASFRGVGDTNVVSIHGHTLLGIEYASGSTPTLDLRYDVRPGITHYRFVAIEWVSDGSGLPLRPLRAIELPPVPASSALDLRFEDIDMTRAALMPEQTTVQVELPATGLLSRGSVRRGFPSRIQYPFAYEPGAARAGFPVGSASADFVRDAPGPLAAIHHFGSSLLPDAAMITYTTEAAAGTGPEITFTAISFGPNETLRVPAIATLASAGSTLDDATVAVAAPEFDAAGFQVFGNDGQIACWVGWQVEGAVIARRTLPPLPTALARTEHFRGATARLVASVERRTMRSVRPWETSAGRAISSQALSALAVVRIPLN